MSGDATLAAVELFVALVAAASLVALVAQRFALPYTVALVVLGLGVAALGPARDTSITPQLVLVVLVPGLVFEAAYRLDVDELRRTFLGVVVLAVPGVLISAGTVALILAAAGLRLDLAFIVGAITSATDPASVVATFRILRAPARLTTLVEAESLFNDGTAIVVFSIAVAALTTPTTPADAIRSFVVTVAASTALGVGLGVVATRLIALANDHLVEQAISVVLAYGTYLLADQAHGSGIIATVVAGLVLGTYGRRIGLRARTFAALDAMWEFAAFLLTALVFLLIGLAITVGQLADDAGAIALGVIGILIGRVLAVYVVLGGAGRVLGARRGTTPLSVAWLHVLFWAGLRGAIAVALALSLPADLPERSHLQGIVFGITLFTLLVQGTTTDILLRRLGVSGEGSAGTGESASGEPSAG
jgi:monovalent cation:H+ antiporter, CPA1 family